MNQYPFYDRVRRAVSEFSFSRIITAESTGRAFRYFMTLIVIIALLQSAVFAFRTTAGMRVLGEVLEEETPDFELRNGLLEIDMAEPYIFNADDQYLVIDPMDSLTFDDIKLMTVKDIMLVQSSKFSTHNQRSGGQDITFYYRDIPFEFDKAELVDFLTNSGRLGFVFFLISLILILIGKLVGSLIAWLFAALVSLFKKARLYGGQTYALALYALTLPSLLKSGTRMMTITIPFFTVFYYIALIFYISKYIDELQEPEIATETVGTVPQGNPFEIE